VAIGIRIFYPPLPNNSLTHLSPPTPLAHRGISLSINPYRLLQPADRAPADIDRHPLEPVHINHPRQGWGRRPLPPDHLLVTLLAEIPGFLSRGQIPPAVRKLLNIREIRLPPAGHTYVLLDDVQLLEVLDLE